MSKTSIDADVRRDLRLALRKNGVNVGRAGELVDLACHATEQSVDKLFAICRSAPDASTTLMAIELALQLTRSRMEGILERTHQLGRGLGVPTYQAEVAMPR